MKGYCTSEDIEAYTLTDILDSFEPNVEKWIGAMEEFIDQETGRSFIADETAVSRFFDGDGDSEFFTDENIEIEFVKIYDSEDTLEYTLLDGVHILSHPYNEKPIRKIFAKPNNALNFSTFPRGLRNIEISAKWGFSENVPEQIRQACTVLVAGIVNFSNNADGEVKSEKIGDYSVTYKDNNFEDFQRAKAIIKNLVKPDVS